MDKVYKPYIEVFGREFDFRVSYRLLDPEEGGRYTPAYQGIRWDFGYEGHDKPGHLFMVYPEIEDENGQLFKPQTPIPKTGFAKMWTLNDELMPYHFKYLKIGTKGTFNEGKPIAICEVVELNFTELIRLIGFKKKHHSRVSFVKLLTEFGDLSLKPAKELLDAMLENGPVDFQILKNRTKDFSAKLHELNVEFERV